MDEQTGHMCSPRAPLSDSIAELCAAHRPVDSAGRFTPGIVFGDWRLTAFIGRGGNGEVYCAEHVKLYTPAAVKILVREGARARERFVWEANLLSMLKSSAFPRFYAYGEAHGVPYLAMELLEPGDLPTGDRDVTRFLLNVCNAAEELHAHGLVHRDIKPANILWRTDWANFTTTTTRGVRFQVAAEPVLADLGLVKDTTRSCAQSFSSPNTPVTTDGVGTPGYGAPEQLERGESTVTSDIHSLGVLADRCFDGKPPSTWARIIRRATSSIPAQRYQSVSAFSRAIRFRNVPRHFLFVGLLLFVGFIIWQYYKEEDIRSVSLNPHESAAHSANELYQALQQSLTPQQPSETENPIKMVETVPVPSSKYSIQKGAWGESEHGPGMVVTAFLDGRPAHDVRYYLDFRLIQMPYRFTEKYLSGERMSYDWLHAVVVRDGVSYSAKMHTIRPNWNGTTNVTLTLKRDPAAGTAVRVWTDRGTPFDFVWCPPGEVTSECTDPYTRTNVTVHLPIGYGYWISTEEATCRQITDLCRRNESDAPRQTEKQSVPFVEDIEMPGRIRSWWSFMDLRDDLYTHDDRVAGFKIAVPNVLEWIHAMQFGGGLPPEETINDYAWIRGGLTKGRETFGRSDRKKPNALGMYNVFGNLAEWVLIPVDGQRWRSGSMALGGSSRQSYVDVKQAEKTAYRVLCGFPVLLGTQGAGLVGVRFTATSYFTHETNAVLFCSAQALLRSSLPADVARGTELMRGILASGDSILSELTRKTLIDQSR